jgi:hypothetical protein
LLAVREGFPRRKFIAGGAGLLAASRLPAVDEKTNLPNLAKRVERVFRAPCKEPNDLAFVPEGLWILDQVDPNTADQTESIHGSGIAFANGTRWIASTKTADGSPPQTMKVDPTTGKTLQQWVTPGSGIWTKGLTATVSGAHGIKFVNGQYWMAVPASGKLFLMEPESGEIVRSIPAPGVRTHGLACDKGMLWCVESNDQAIYKFDPEDGRILAKIQLSKQDPGLHGMDIKNGGFGTVMRAAVGFDDWFRRHVR